MSENKTITQLALDAGVETGGTENALAILKFAKSYADQEKRSTAIAFAGWVRNNGYYVPNSNLPVTYCNGPTNDWPQLCYTIDELYDLFNSL